MGKHFRGRGSSARRCENQHLGALHFHGLARLANPYQRGSLAEIARKIPESPRLAEGVKAWRARVHREEYWGPQEHSARLATLEQEWR